MKKAKTTFYYLFVLMMFASCTKRNLAYFSDLPMDSVYTENIANSSEPSIQPDDLLSITVNSLNPEANVLFNNGFMPNPTNAVISSNNTTPMNATGTTQGYLVDKDGFIDFPVLGKIKVGGLNTIKAKSFLTTQLQEYLKEPTVNIQYLNFRITVMGEVVRPTTFTISSEKINVLEALGMAGDMTPFGRRENVLIIRETEGVRTYVHLNLNSRNMLQSPYFYLKQNDIVYVEPDKAQLAKVSTARSNIAIALSTISLITIIIYRFF